MSTRRRSLPTGYHSPQMDVEVRLNTNESPWPPPVGFAEKLAEEISRLAFNRYPDREATRLREAIGARHAVEASQVFCTNGSNESIQLVLLARGGPGKRASVFTPTYALHSHLSRLTGTEILEHERAEDFRLRPDLVKQVAVSESPEIVFLCIPNNPTGTLDEATVIDAALSGAGLVLVDEAYGEFAGVRSVATRTAGEDVVVFRTFSKAWAMAGLRLGYTIAAEGLVSEMEQLALPYHLDAVKQVAGRVALSFESEMTERVAAIVSERDRIGSELRSMSIRTWDSAANFVLFRPEASASVVWAELVQRSVLVRDLSSMPGLDGCLRVTAGTATENDRFLAALSDVLKEGS